MNSEPFVAWLTIEPPYLPPMRMPFLDGILWGALARSLGGNFPSLDMIPLERIDTVFCGSGMISPDILPAEWDGAITTTTTFRASIVKEEDLSKITREMMYGKQATTRFRGNSTELLNAGVGKGVYRTTQSTHALYYPLLPGGSQQAGGISQDRAWRVRFYGVGDIAEVERLLNVLPGLGRKTMRGYGAIKRVEVTPVDTDYSLVRNGIALRPMPAKLAGKIGVDLTRYIPLRRSIAPPYLVSEEVECITPDGHYISEGCF